MKTVVSLCLSETIDRAVRASLQNAAQMEICQHQDGLIELARRTRARLVVCELVADGVAGGATPAALREIRSRMPHVGVLVVCTPSPRIMALAKEVWRVGIRHVVLYPFDDLVATMRRALNRVVLADVEHRIVGSLPPGLSADANRVIRLCVRNAHRRPTVTRIAKQLGMCERTLERRCREMSLPSPEELIARCRMLMTLEMVRIRRCSLQRASQIFGFRNAADLRTRLKRHTGLTVQEARRFRRCTELLFQRRAPRRRVAGPRAALTSAPLQAS